VTLVTVTPRARAFNAAFIEEEARMEYLVGGAAFAIYLVAQLLAVVARPPRQPFAGQARADASATVTPRLPLRRRAWI
jgi:hypothetical protein